MHSMNKILILQYYDCQVWQPFCILAWPWAIPTRIISFYTSNLQLYSRMLLLFKGMMVQQDFFAPEIFFIKPLPDNWVRRQVEPHEQLTYPSTGCKAVFKYQFFFSRNNYYPQHSLLQIQVNVQVNKILILNNFTDISKCPSVQNLKFVETNLHICFA